MTRRLRVAISEIPVLLVTRQEYREIEASVPIGRSPWNADGIYVMSDDLAKQSDMAAGLSTIDWDLVIIDEAHRLAAPQRGALLDRLITAGHVRRILLLSATPHPALDRWLRPLPAHESALMSSPAVTSWFGVLSDWDGAAVIRPSVQMKVFHYRRGAEEVKFLTHFLELAPSLVTACGGNELLTPVLTRRASSSLFAIEQSLRRLGHTLRSTTAAQQVEQPFFAEDIEQMATDGRFDWADKQAALTIVDGLLEALDMITADEKLNALEQLLGSIVNAALSEVLRICIVSTFPDTVSYLHTGIAETGLTVFKVTGTSSFAERQAEFARFLREGGLMVVTDAALPDDTALQQVTDVIQYDLPSNPQLLEQRRGRFDPVGRQDHLRMHFLIDDSGAMPLESHLVKMLPSAK
jgi:hypothetical protein